MNIKLKNKSAGILRLALLCAIPLGAASAQGGVIITPPTPCPDNGSCHLSRWTPENPLLAQSMGDSVAIDGDLAVVGLPGSNRVEIWTRQTSTWKRQQTLLSPGANGDRFGQAVAIHNSQIWVGAPNNDDQATNAGAVYKFTSGLTRSWSLDRTMYAQVPVGGGRFGTRIAVNLSWLTISEPRAPAGGRVTAYTRFGGTATFREILTVPGSAQLGRSLAIDGNNVAMGDPIGGASAGAVHVAKLSLAFPTQITMVQSPGTQPGDKFGTSVAIGPEGLFIGAPGHDQPSANTGIAYRFKLQNGPGFGFTEEETFSPCLATAAMEFGHSLALDERTLVIGTRTAEAAYILKNKGILGLINWQLEDRLQAADSMSGDFFGSAVALSGSTVLVGAFGADATATDSGAAYLFSLDPVLTGLTQCPSNTLWTIEAFGPGKPGKNGIPALQTGRPLTPGVTTTIGAINLTPGTQPILIYGFIETNIPLDGGLLHIADPVLIPLPTVSSLGQVGLNLSIPPVAALAGNQIIAQVMVVDPAAAGALNIAQSQGYRATVGF